MIGLCSKTYVVSKSDHECKFSSKGVGKRFVTDPLGTFRDVLQSQRPATGTNRGFRARNNGIFTYEQERTGFSYFYCKRRVLDDGIHTVPLDITLCPLKPDKRAPGNEERNMTDSDLVNMLAEWLEESET